MPEVPLAIRASVRVYRVLTRLYPRSFQERYGCEMTHVFEKWIADRWRHQRWLGLTNVWSRALVDLTWNIILQHVHTIQEVKTMTTATTTTEGTISLGASPGHSVPHRNLMIVGVGLALTNTLLWFVTPTLRTAVDAAAGRLDAPDRPFIVRGVQELLVYFDPWLAWFVFPTVFTLGFAAIPFLLSPGPNLGSRGEREIKFTMKLLFFLEAIWLFLIWVGVWCRGPNWHFYWPGQAWDPARNDAFNYIDISQLFWTSLLNVPTQEMSAVVRELPGLLLLAAYFVAGYFLFRWRRSSDAGGWRVAFSTILLLVAIAIPFKMCCRILWEVRYIVALPEIHISI